MSNKLKLFALLSLLMLLFGCAAQKLHREGIDLIAGDRIEEGIIKLEAAVKADPDNLQFRSELIKARSAGISKLLALGATQRAAGKFTEAEATYRRILSFDPSNERALTEINLTARSQRHIALIEQANEIFKKGDHDKALDIIKPVMIEDPTHTEMLGLKRNIEERKTKAYLAITPLKSAYSKPITLEFRDANLKMVFEVLSRTSGINFVLDKDVRSDLRTTLFLKQSSIEDAVDLLLATNQLEKKVLNENSMLIYPNTPAKLKEYQDLVVRSFYLSNADVKQTANMLKMLLKGKDIFIDEKLNLLVMRDTPEAIQLAEKLIKVQDLAEPEVMLEVEVLEIKRSRLLELGIKYPDQLTLAPIASSGSTVTLNDIKNLGSNRISASLSSMVINAKKEDGDVNILANPRIRARNREKAKIMIGDKVPVITTTSTATGFVSESVQYLDVGLKLEVEPNVHIPDDVAIKIALEVSSIVREIRSGAGTLSYQVGTRNASTVLRLKDGETQVLAGLISDEDRRTANKVPGLGELPILGRLFSSQRDDNQKTEIVLSITPRLVRSLQRPEAMIEEFWSGTETSLKTKPLALPPVKTAANEKTNLPSNTVTTTPETQPVSEKVPSEKAAEEISLAWQGPAQVKSGEQFTVALKLKSNTEIRTMPLQLSFDPAALEITEVSEGEFFKQGGARSNFTNNVDAVNGKLFVGVARQGQDAGAKGEDTAVKITFKAKAAQPKTEIKILAATPIGGAGKLSSLKLPAAYEVSVK